MTEHLDSLTQDEVSALVEIGNRCRENVAAEAAVRIAFATMIGVVDYFGDPRLGALISDSLVRAAADQPAGVVRILGVAAKGIAARTGAAVPSRFAPN